MDSYIVNKIKIGYKFFIPQLYEMLDQLYEALFYEDWFKKWLSSFISAKG